MTGEGEEETYELLADQRLGRLGLHVKLDRGFNQGVYNVTVEYDGLAEREGFAAARRTAGKYCKLLREQLGRSGGDALGEIEDPSRTGRTRGKRDPTLTFLSFAVETPDGRSHDRALREQFRVAFLRAGQAWEQAEAGAQSHRRQTRRERFRRQLAELLASPAYARMEDTFKDRLLDDVTALAFPPRVIGP
jgi:hypothetical protein